MRSGVQAGSHTMLTLTWPTPGTLATAFSTICGISAAAGQFDAHEAAKMPPLAIPWRGDS